MIPSGRYIGYLPVSYAARWVAIDRMRNLLPERFRLITDIETVTRKGAALSLVSQAFLDLMRERCGDLGLLADSQRPSPVSGFADDRFGFEDCLM